MQDSLIQIANQSLQGTPVTYVGMVFWYFFGICFVYMHLWFKKDVSEGLLGPIVYMKEHTRSTVFSLLTYTLVFVGWMTVGIQFQFNGDNLVSLEKGKINALMLALIAYSSNSFFNSILAKFQKNLPSDDDVTTDIVTPSKP